MGGPRPAMRLPFLYLAIVAVLPGCSGVRGDASSSLGQSPHGISPTSVSAAASDATILASAPEGISSDSDRLAAYNYLNTVRVKCGFGARIQNVALDNAAQAHAVKVGIRSASDVQFLDSRTVATFPCDGQTDVTTTHGDETPSPLPGRSLSIDPAGRVIVAVARVNQALAVSEFSVAPRSGRPLKATLLTSATDPNKLLPSNVVALIPHAPLATKTTYTANWLARTTGSR